MAGVGQELLAVPLPEMVMKLGLGIAEAQRALDENSVETSVLLADTTVPLVLAVTQTIAADGTVSFVNADPVDVSLLQMMPPDALSFCSPKGTQSDRAVSIFVWCAGQSLPPPTIALFPISSASRVR